MRNKNFSGNISGKGYYIALILCAIAIGITGYLYYRNANPEPQLSEPGQNTTPQILEKDTQVAATEPNDMEISATEQPQAPTGKPKTIVRPVSGDVTAPYSMDALAYNQTTRDWRVHNGMDIAAEAGTPVSAAADGTVYTVCEDETMGFTVVITHSGGYTTEYASLAENVSVKPGDTVTAGQTIGYVGSTALLESGVGEHVHFSVSCNGERMDPSDFFELN